MPNIVLQTSMFDKGHYDTKSSNIAQPRSPLDHEQSQFGNSKYTAPSKEDFHDDADPRLGHAEQIQCFADTTPEGIMRTQGNYKLLLKCMRIWKIYAKQEIYRREQARLLEVEKAREMQERLDSEIELSKEISEIIHECAIARNHYNNHLMLLGFQSLCRNLIASRRHRSHASTRLERGKRERLLLDYFSAWARAIEKAKAKRMLVKSLEQKHEERL